jgi:hypothetical protein
MMFHLMSRGRFQRSMRYLRRRVKVPLTRGPNCRLRWERLQ